MKGIQKSPPVTALGLCRGAEPFRKRQSVGKRPSFRRDLARVGRSASFIVANSANDQVQIRSSVKGKNYMAFADSLRFCPCIWTFTGQSMQEEKVLSVL